MELTGRENRDLIYQVTAASENGAVRVRLSGYRLRIIEHHEEYPAIADLVFPETRDRQILGQALEEACRDMQLEAPCVESACIPLVHNHHKQERRQLEAPVLERLLRASAERYDVPATKLSIRWRDDGKPVVADVPASILDVSLTHEDRTCLCVCAPGPVGCDLASATPRTRDAWIGLLGGFRSDLLDLLMEHGDPLDIAGTRIWAAAETLVKTGETTGADLKIAKRQGRTVLFEAQGKDKGAMRILTLPVRLTWGHPMIFAVTVKEKASPRVPKHLLTAAYPGYEPLYETRSFEMVENGPQGQLVFVKRLPVTFQPSANLSRTIYFSNYIKWMGSTREASAWPVMAEMSGQFASGRWGGVTNYGHLKILGEGGSSDRIEILMWVCDNSGPENSTMTLSYDFRKMLKDGGFQRLAFCRLQTTWVEIPAPGVAKVAPYPPYYGQFIEGHVPAVRSPGRPGAHGGNSFAPVRHRRRSGGLHGPPRPGRAPRRPRTDLRHRPGPRQPGGQYLLRQLLRMARPDPRQLLFPANPGILPRHWGKKANCSPWKAAWTTCAKPCLSTACCSPWPSRNCAAAA